METLALWSTMNQWVYEGFDVTYKRLGVDFDKIYYESETYLLGKAIVEEGLQKGVLYKSRITPYGLTFRKMDSTKSSCCDLTELLFI